MLTLQHLLFQPSYGHLFQVSVTKHKIFFRPVFKGLDYSQSDCGRGLGVNGTSKDIRHGETFGLSHV